MTSSAQDLSRVMEAYEKRRIACDTQGGPQTSMQILDPKPAYLREGGQASVSQERTIGPLQRYVYLLVSLSSIKRSRVQLFSVSSLCFIPSS